MARPKKIGNEQCPHRDCKGLDRLGYRRRKPMRNRPDSMYVDRYFFRHNDRNIPEHYIDNCIRPNEKENVYHQLGKIYREIGYRIGKRSNRILSHADKLTKEDWTKFVQDFDWFGENVAVPMFAIAAIDMGLVEVSIDFHRELREVLRQNLMSDKNVFGFGYRFFDEKYVRPLRNEERNKKISEGWGKWPNVFTGIESESETKSIKPKTK